MSKSTSLIKESWTEVTENVTWPAFSDLQSSSVLVLVASLIFALLVGAVDLSSNLVWIYFTLHFNQ